MAKRNIIKGNWPKYLLQWGTLAALIFFSTGLYARFFPNMTQGNPEAYCPMGGLEALATYLSSNTLPCSMTSLQIMMGLVMAAAVILFSKLFCSYLCPLGTVEDILTQLRDSIHLKSIYIPNGCVADKLLRIIKYLMLFWIFYMTMSTSELFCRKLDPYYAAITGFRGEISIVLSALMLVLLVLGGLVVDRFWCRFICPLGAISNTLKFWMWVLVVTAIYYTAVLFNMNVSWSWILGIFCFMGYFLEILHGKPKLQLLHMVRNENSCNHCEACERTCPYKIEITKFYGHVNSVDCTLCGDCAAACKHGALHVGFIHHAQNNIFKVMLPAVITVILVLLGLHFGKKFEVPTINETWGLEDYDEDSTLVQVVDPATLSTFEMDNLTGVKCFGSSKAFAARLKNIPGTHGVKTYVDTHRAVIKYDPSVTNEDEIRRQAFIPSRISIAEPDPQICAAVSCRTILVDKLFDKIDFIKLSDQFAESGRKIYGTESEYGCPVKVRVYVDSTENMTSEWFKEVIPSNLKFAGFEGEAVSVPVGQYMRRMFTVAEFSFEGRYLDHDGNFYKKPRTELYKNKSQYIYELADKEYGKPEFRKELPYLANWISGEDGIISLRYDLNEELVPSVQIRYAYPATSDKIWKIVCAGNWKISYGENDVREEPARLTFTNPGTVRPADD